jgi:hypothetical protein
MQRKTAAAGVILLVIAFATGLLLAAAMTKSVAADPPVLVAAHLNAVLGCLWLVALAVTLPMLRFGDRGRHRIVQLTMLATYANWSITTVKSFLHVDGVGPDGNHTNDGIFVALTVFVVVPSFVAAIAWAWGLLGKPSE